MAKVFTVQLSGDNAPQIKAYADEKDIPAGNGHGVKFSSALSLLSSNVTGPAMITLYNRYAGEGNAVKKFADRKIAARRCFELFDKAVPIEATEDLPTFLKRTEGKTAKEIVADMKKKAPTISRGAFVAKAKKAEQEQKKKEAKARFETAKELAGIGVGGGDKSATVKKPSKTAKASAGAPGRRSTVSNERWNPTAKTKKEGNKQRAGGQRFKSLQIVLDNPGITTEEFVRKGGKTVNLLEFTKWGRIERA